MKLTSRVALLPVGLLLLLQGCDLLLTWRLLSGAHPDVHEANPLAATLLQHFGWTGVALLKLATSTLLLLVIFALGRRRPVVATRLLGGLCLVMAGVILYSGWLLLRPVDPLVRQMPGMAEQDARLTHYIDGVGRFARKRRVICIELLGGRIDLSAGVRRMKDCLAEEQPHLASSMLAYLPVADRPEEVAAFLYFHASRLVKEGEASQGALTALEQQMSRSYPTAARLDDRGEVRTGLFPWGPGRHVLSHLSASASTH